MYGILVLCMGYWSYVWNISLMSGILLLCLGICLMSGKLSYVWDPTSVLLWHRNPPGGVFFTQKAVPISKDNDF